MKRGRWMAVAGASLLTLAAGAQTVRYGPPIRFSAPKSDTVGTNLNQFTDKARNNLRRLEEELSQPLEVFRNQNDATAPLAAPLPRPPAGPVIQSKRIRDLLDQKNNWVFSAPEDQISGLTPEEMMGVTEFDEAGNPKTRSTALERFNERLDREQSGNTNRLAADRIGNWAAEADWSLQEDGEARAPRNAVEARLMEAEKGLQELFKNNSTTKFLPDLEPKLATPDLFAPKPVVPGEKSWEQKAQEARLDQFRQMMQPDTLKPASLPVLGGGSAGSSFTPLPPSSPGAATPLPTWAEPKPTQPAATAMRKPVGLSPAEIPRRKF